MKTLSKLGKGPRVEGLWEIARRSQPSNNSSELSFELSSPVSLQMIAALDKAFDCMFMIDLESEPPLLRLSKTPNTGKLCNIAFAILNC